MNLNTEQYFSTIPDVDAPRSVFDRSFTLKTTMNVNDLVPIFIDEALPGDSFQLDFECFGRALNPLVVPVMDELYFETLWFKCECRLLWNNFYRFCGEQDNPTDSVDFIIPTINSGETGFSVDSIADHFGIPVKVANIDVNSLPFRMYNRVYNEWFRDINLINSLPLPLDDSDDATNYVIQKSAKMHDYFTSALPNAQKGSPTEIPITFDGSIPVVGNGSVLGLTDGTVTGFGVGVDNYISGKSGTLPSAIGTVNSSSAAFAGRKGIGVVTDVDKSGLQANVGSLGTTIGIEDVRFAFKLQRKKEMDMLGGTRYISWVRTHFNVKIPNSQAFRSEFLGSTREMIDINTVIQTSESDKSPQGTMAAYGVISHHGSGFTTSFDEHSYIMGIARIRHNPVYQQGLHRMWTRSTLLDFYLPVFNGLGEQPIRNDEIYCQSNSVIGDSGQPVNQEAFGFQEFAAPYRYKPSMITGLLRTNSSTSSPDISLDFYHLAQYFTELPKLNQSFIEENIPVTRIFSINKYEQDYPEDYPDFIMDFSFNYHCARRMPVRNIPSGLYDRF